MALNLKRLRRENLGAAIEKAAHYRDLNQPEEAESICLDVLDVESEHQTAWKLLGLALTDRLRSGQPALLEPALEAFAHLSNEYERTYHLGVAWERAAKAHLERNEAHSAVTGFENALRLYEKAETLRPDLPDPLLRWNRCVRMLTTQPSLRAALLAPPEAHVHLGD